MDGAGGRLGRSSSRFAPAASAFTGPVRRWTKRWVPLPYPSYSSPSNKSKTTTSNNEESSHLILFKWTPASSSSSQTNASDPPPPPKRKFRYVPVSVTGEQMKVAAENSDSEARASNGKPDADDLFMDESQEDDKDTEPTEEANESKLDLNLS